MDGEADRPENLPREQRPQFALLSRSAPVITWALVLALIAAGAALVAFGPWGVVVNAVVLTGGLFLAFLVLDLV